MNNSQTCFEKWTLCQCQKSLRPVRFGVLFGFFMALLVLAALVLVWFWRPETVAFSREAELCIKRESRFVPIGVTLHTIGSVVLAIVAGTAVLASITGIITLCQFRVLARKIRELEKKEEGSEIAKEEQKE